MTTRKTFLAFLLGAVALTSLPTAQAAGPASANDCLRLHQVKIIDPAGFGRPVEAASILLPKDWKVESGVVWTGDTGCPRNGIQLSLKAQSPDGKLGFEVFPGYTWSWENDPQVRYYAQQALTPYGIKGCDYLTLRCGRLPAKPLPAPLARGFHLGGNRPRTRTGPGPADGIYGLDRRQPQPGADRL